MMNCFTASHPMDDALVASNGVLTQPLANVLSGSLVEIKVTITEFSD